VIAMWRFCIYVDVAIVAGNAQICRKSIGRLGLDCSSTTFSSVKNITYKLIDLHVYMQRINFEHSSF
jgi:hypothetical protein